MIQVANSLATLQNLKQKGVFPLPVPLLPPSILYYNFVFIRETVYEPGVCCSSAPLCSCVGFLLTSWLGLEPSRRLSRLVLPLDRILPCFSASVPREDRVRLFSRFHRSQHITSRAGLSGPHVHWPASLPSAGSGPLAASSAALWAGSTADLGSASRSFMTCSGHFSAR